MICDCCYNKTSLDDIYYVNSGNNYKLEFLFVCKTCMRDISLKIILDDGKV